MITVVGIGPGAPELMLAGMTKWLTQADVVIGSARQLASLPVPTAKQKVLPRLSELQTFINQNWQKQIVLLASGDPLLFGIGTWVLHHFERRDVKIIPGVSSIQYCFHQFGLSMNNCYLTSSHGRQPDFDFLLAHQTIGMVTDDVIGPYEIAQEIKKRHQKRQIYIGEHLSYPDERLSQRTAETVEKRNYQLNVVIITNA